MKVKINNIEFRKYEATKTDEKFYEIIKWQNNDYYGKEEEYRVNGYLDDDNYLRKDFTNISKSLFKLPETCYMIASVHKNSEGWYLKSVGERLLELTPEEWNDFHQVYTLGQSKLNKTK
jgi:hypothetical protein